MTVATKASMSTAEDTGARALQSIRTACETPSALAHRAAVSSGDQSIRHLPSRRLRLLTIALTLLLLGAVGASIFLAARQRHSPTWSNARS